MRVEIKFPNHSKYTCYRNDVPNRSTLLLHQTEEQVTADNRACSVKVRFFMVYKLSVKTQNQMKKIYFH